MQYYNYGLAKKQTRFIYSFRFFGTFTYFRIRGAGATDEARFVAEAASVHTHLQSIKFRIK